MIIALHILSICCLVWALLSSIVFALHRGDPSNNAKINTGIAVWFIAGGVLWIAGVLTGAAQ